MKCENCNSEHNGSYGSGRFCSSICARGYSTKNKRLEINAKVSKSLMKKPSEKICPTCSNSFIRFGKSKFCSKTCSSIVSEITKQKLSKNAKEMHVTGKIKSWSSRTKLEPSYAEKYFIDLFNNEKIEYEREVRIGKWFVDFITHGVVIEIDGHQHSYEDRVNSDKLKDEFLASQGIQVVRIKWYNPVNDRNRKLLYDQIDTLKKHLGFA